ncbi:MAG TPA: YsnF/AvaK domain-containing protein [Ktedonobacterales bacterium]|nr:YsnF/AvaK domain-containing protein [Ktedonobacterales bacterium]
MATGTEGEDEGTQLTAPGAELAGRIHAGMRVFDARGEHLGDVEGAESGRGYIVVQAGRILKRDLYIPLAALAGVDERGVHLRVATLELDKLDWYLPPTDGVDVDTPYSPPSETALQTSQAGRVQVPVVEEQLAAKTRAQSAGSAVVHTDVVHEQQSLTVPVRHEELRVEGRPVAPAAAYDLGPEVFIEADVDVPLMGERVQVEKRARVIEEVVLNKVPVTEERTITETVRRERVRVEGPDSRDISEQDTITYDRPVGQPIGPGTPPPQ